MKTIKRPYFYARLNYLDHNGLMCEYSFHSDSYFEASTRISNFLINHKDVWHFCHSRIEYIGDER